MTLLACQPLPLIALCSGPLVTAFSIPGLDQIWPHPDSPLLCPTTQADTTM